MGAPGEGIEAGPRDRHRRTWAAAASRIFLAPGALGGFVILRNFQRENAGPTSWRRSAGRQVSPRFPATASNQRGRGPPVSQVAWSPDVFEALNYAAPERGRRTGGTDLRRLSWDNGVSTVPEIPAGSASPSAAIYKLLRDYRSGARIRR